MLVLTQVCARVGMDYTNLPASLLCALLANSATKRDVRRVHNAADIPCPKIWLPYGNGPLCQDGYGIGYAGSNSTCIQYSHLSGDGAPSGLI